MTSQLLTLPGEIDIFLRRPNFTDAASLVEFDALIKNEESLQGNDADEISMPLDERKNWINAVTGCKDCFTLLAEHQGRVIGLLESGTRERPRMNAHVMRFYISIQKEYWGKGLGSALLEKMLDWGKSQPQIEKVSLNVLSTNRRAIHLYQKFGFKEDGRKKENFFYPMEAMWMICPWRFF